MNTETIIAELERFQKRFAGGDSKTIDAAVTSLRSLVASNATLRNQRNDTRAEVTKLKAALALGCSLSRLYTVLPAHRRDRIGGAA